MWYWGKVSDVRSKAFSLNRNCRADKLAVSADAKRVNLSNKALSLFLLWTLLHCIIESHGRNSAPPKMLWTLASISFSVKSNWITSVYRNKKHKQFLWSHSYKPLVYLVKKARENQDLMSRNIDSSLNNLSGGTTQNLCLLWVIMYKVHWTTRILKRVRATNTVPVR